MLASGSAAGRALPAGAWAESIESFLEEVPVKLSIFLRLGIVVLAGAIAMAGAAGQEKAASQKAPAKSGAAKAAEVAPAAQFGSKESAKWTDTTTAAAGSPEQKAVLASGKPMTVTGELVEMSCFLQLGKRGEKHIPCGTKCLQSGQPFGVVTANNQVYLIMAEEHDPRRDGQADTRTAMIPMLAKQVRVTGMHTMHNGYHAIFVSAVAVSAAH
jgi:hypothetical protein